jgi:hypothetical protein
MAIRNGMSLQQEIYDSGNSGGGVPSGHRYGGGGGGGSVVRMRKVNNPEAKCVCGAARKEHNGELHLGGCKPSGCRRFKTAA